MARPRRPNERRGQAADLLIHHARIRAMGPPRPHSEAVAVSDGRIVAVGSNEDLEGLAGRDSRRFDARGATLLPGIVDPHLHLLAYAARLRSVDLSQAHSIAELQTLLQEAAGRLRPGVWLGGMGYDDWALAEKRHPTRRDLDVVPGRPVRIIHRSGHASVLNSLALQHVGIGIDTEEPAGGTIEREVPNGEPSGLLLDMEDYLKARVPRLPPQELEAGVQEASRRLLSWGVTSVEDATPNGLGDLRVLTRLAKSAAFRPALAAMVDARRVSKLAGAGVKFNRVFGDILVREAKVILSASSGRLHPSKEELLSLVKEASAQGFPVAVHAIEAEALHLVLDVLEEAGVQGLPHRVEHASICPPELLERLQRRGLRVVTQPAFLYLSGDRYLETVDVADQPWLYRATAFLRTGLTVAASSDAPVTPPDPRLGLYGTVTRRSKSGNYVGSDPPLSPEEALPLFMTNAAAVVGWGEERGWIAPGYHADLALWDRDLDAVEDPEELLKAQVVTTFVGGELAHGG